MQKGDLVEVLEYRGKEPTIKLGRVEKIRNICNLPLKLKTYRKYLIARSESLITLKGSDGKTYRSYYDKFLNYRPVSFWRRIWLKIRGKI